MQIWTKKKIDMKYGDIHTGDLVSEATRLMS